MVLTEFILLAREELAVFIEVFVLSILAANDDESVEVVLNTLWIDDANDELFEFIVLLTLLKLEENDAEFNTILDASEDEAKSREDFIEVDTTAAEEEIADIFEFAAIMLSFIDWDTKVIDADTTLMLPDIEPSNEDDTTDMVLMIEDETCDRLFCTRSNDTAIEEEFWFILLYTTEILLDMLSASEEDVDVILPLRVCSSVDNTEILPETEFENEDEKLFISTANDEELSFILPVTKFIRFTNDEELFETAFVISAKLWDIAGSDEEFIPRNSLYKLLLLWDIATSKEEEIFVIMLAIEADVLIA